MSEKNKVPDLGMAQMRPDPCQDMVFWRSDAPDGKQVTIVYDQEHDCWRLIVYPTVYAYVLQSGGVLLGDHIVDFRKGMAHAQHELGLTA